MCVCCATYLRCFNFVWATSLCEIMKLFHVWVYTKTHFFCVSMCVHEQSKWVTVTSSSGGLILVISVYICCQKNSSSHMLHILFFEIHSEFFNTHTYIHTHKTNLSFNLFIISTHSTLYKAWYFSRVKRQYSVKRDRYMF